MPLLPIREIAARAGFAPGDLRELGPHTAKVSIGAADQISHRGKLILVTAINPTKHGEGKTVTSIGLSQAINRLGPRSIVTLRQPSLGPVFGVKGGAAGGGLSCVEPASAINLHFTGDFHAVTSAHNLLAALLDAHLFHGNELGIDPARTWWPRAMDMNDRALRRITVGEGATRRETGFIITAASEVMAILALASSRQDLIQRLGNIVVALDRSGGAVRASGLEASGAMAALLNDAVLPNLVQTTENTPALIHAGPFGNVAHGTSSVIAQRTALQTASYVVNEAGFGSDLGAEKYFNIVMPASGIKPAVAVVVASVRALEAQGGDFANLRHHIRNLRQFHVPVVVAINRFPADTQEELDQVARFCAEEDTPCALSEVFSKGGAGGLDLARKVLDAASQPSDPQPIYAPGLPLTAKIEAIATRVYGAAAVAFDPAAAELLDTFSRLGFGHLPVCIAKSQYSLTGEGGTVRITGASLSAGAGFVVATAGNMMLMPGLGKDPQAARIGVDDSGAIYGI
ncbi:MAG: formate--tetrahydrofolate ligase [Acidobacteria bacterium]|nr:formate--tetrahydrofolate ligase [Acidobacteriota bacterium]